MAKINLKTKIRRLEGEPVKWKIQQSGKNEEKEADLDIRMVCTAALLGSHADERISGDEKAARYSLAIEIHNAKSDIELRSEDVTLLKKLIGLSFAPLIVGQSYRILDPAEKNK